MLEADAVKFDQFLRENEAKVNDTIKRAEGEAKKRSERQLDVKRLHAKIAALRAEVRTHAPLSQNKCDCVAAHNGAQLLCWLVLLRCAHACARATHVCIGNERVFVSPFLVWAFHPCAPEAPGSKL